MAKKGVTRRELLDRWRGIEEYDDDDDDHHHHSHSSPASDSSSRHRLRLLKEEWFVLLLSFLSPLLLFSIHIFSLFLGSWTVIFFWYYYWFPRTRRPRIAFLSNCPEVGSSLYEWMVLICVLAPSFFFPQLYIIIHINKESILEFLQQCDFLVNLPAHACVNLQVAKAQLRLPVVGFRKTMLFEDSKELNVDQRLF